MNVTVFKGYPFKEGELIRIEDSPRAGDWEVISHTEHTVTLRCPHSKKEIKWSRFCYFVDTCEQEWPCDD